MIDAKREQTREDLFGAGVKAIERAGLREEAEIIRDSKIIADAMGPFVCEFLPDMNAPARRRWLVALSLGVVDTARKGSKTGPKTEKA